MSHWIISDEKRGSTVVIVICRATEGEDDEPQPAICAIPLQAGCNSDHDEIVVGDGDDYMYLDMEQCAQA